MRTETITIYSYSELSEEAKATAYKAWEPDYALPRIFRGLRRE